MAVFKDFFKSVKLCVTEKSFGNTIIGNTTGKAMKYLFVLMLIIGTVTMIKFEVLFSTGYDEVVKTVLMELPDFKLRNGMVEFSGKMPYIKEFDSYIFAVDTSGQINEDILNKYKDGVFISDSKIIMKRNIYETRSYNLRDLKGIEFTKGDMIQLLKNISIPIKTAVFIFGLLFIYIAKLFGVIFLSLIGLIVDKIVKSKLTYADVFKLTIYAATLPTIVKALVELAGIKVPFFFIVYYGIAIYYFVGYMKELKITNDFPEMKEEA